MAERESVKYFPGNPESTRQDAARHCIWQGLTTESSNAGFAEQVGNAHELDSGSPIEGSSAMDMRNNVTGREVGKRHDGDRVGIISECVSLARNAKRWNPRTAPPNRDGKGLI
ncbi:DUF6973 domain-containing protein [Gordonia phthalatica]|uniref:DUF6973 domain-containing protein n=1 Tax=Gordonia phthalatica TaxID=1136941 RepID=UPI003AB0240C